MYYLKKKNQKIVVYQLSSIGHLQFVLPYHQHLSQSKNLSFFVSTDYEMYQGLTKLNIPKRNFFPTSIAQYLNVIDVFLETEFHNRGPVKACKIYIGHGQMNKHTNWDPENLKAFDVYFLYTPLEREMFELVKSNHPNASQHIQLMNVGNPKLDDLVNHHYSRSDWFEKIKLNKELKTIIYAPAWDPGGSLRTQGIDVIKTLLDIKDINVIVKLHPASFEPSHSPYFEFYTGGKSWQKEFSMFENNPRFHFVKDYLINPYLFISDLMVTDFSGVALEYMILDRPIIHIDCPEYYEKVLPSWNSDGNLARNNDCFNGGRNVGSVVYSLSELKSQVELECQTPQLNALKRKEFSSKILYNPGTASKVGADIILKLMHHSK